MHTYSINKNYRKTSIISILIISFILNSILYVPIDNFIILIQKNYPTIKPFFEYLSSIGISINQFSVLSIFGLLYLLYSKLLWKKLPFRLFHRTPNISGKWSGKLISSYKDNSGNPINLNMNIKVKQNWDKISIRCYFPSSSSYSKSASLLIGVPQGDVLIFTYVNNSDDPSIDNRLHEGCTILVLDDNELSGKYYTDRGNGTHGHIELKKE